MNEFEFLNYQTYPEEKYFLGIAAVRVYGKIILKYKIVQKKDGTGYFIAPPNYRLPVGGGEYKYTDAFLLDSRMEHDEMLQFIREHVNQSESGNTRPPNQQQQQQQQQAPAQTQPDLDSCPF